MIPLPICAMVACVVALSMAAGKSLGSAVLAVRMGDLWAGALMFANDLAFSLAWVVICLWLVLGTGARA